MPRLDAIEAKVFDTDTSWDLIQVEQIRMKNEMTQMKDLVTF